MEKRFLWGIFLWCSVAHSTRFFPEDNYLIDCGSSVNKTVDDRVFLADIPGSSFSMAATNSVYAANYSSSIVGSMSSYSHLYATARIFTSKSSYTFPLRTRGRHWVRLHFFPFTYRTFDLTEAQFSVQTQENLLLSDFQAQNTSVSVLKEFSLVTNSETVALSFTPLPNSFAFVNAIELVSVPSRLLSDDDYVLGLKKSIINHQSLPLETMFRVNMGGPFVPPMNDTLHRAWVTDREFLLFKRAAISVSTRQALTYTGRATTDTAPRAVYASAAMMNPSNGVHSKSFNITWQFPLDFSYSYLIRMHFCDLVSNGPEELVFNAYIGDSSAVTNLDIYSILLSSVSPYFVDFVLPATSGLGTLNVSVGPSTLIAVSQNATLNGLEIMKFVSPLSPSSKNGKKIALIIVFVVGIPFLIVFSLLAVCMLRRWGEQKLTFWFSSSLVTSTAVYAMQTLQNSAVGIRFRFVELQEATNNFDESCVIGVGGFGRVFRGELPDGKEVAVKRANIGAQQGMREFLMEIHTFSEAHHRNLVSLVGFCDEQPEMILVYEYMPNGSLKDHLYGSNLPGLSWEQRLNICIGAARGLHYLHTSSVQGIIHRDVKSANILLDENLMGKVSDFGLSKIGPDLDHTHVSTAVKGSFGYLDPEYARTQQLTKKSDVYSLGVVLLEVLCARPVRDHTLPGDHLNIVDWGLSFHRAGRLPEVVDSRLSGTINPASLTKYWETIEVCLEEYGADRPTMGEVMWNLENALQLQEAEPTPPEEANDGNGVNHMTDLQSQISHRRRCNGTVEMAERNAATSGFSRLSASGVFSMLFNTEGR